VSLRETKYFKTFSWHIYVLKEVSIFSLGGDWDAFEEAVSVSNRNGQLCQIAYEAST